MRRLNKTKNSTYKSETSEKPISVATLNNEISIKQLESIYDILYEDNFSNILIISKNSFLTSIENNINQILHSHPISKIKTDNQIQEKLEKLKNDIFSRYNEDYNILNDAYKKYKNNTQKNMKISENYNNIFLTHFRKHCVNTEKFAYHRCSDGNISKFLKILDPYNMTEIKFILCINCKKSYLPDCINMTCCPCNKDYFSNILQPDENSNILPATWEKYHCGRILMDQVMKCVKCNSELYINILTNKLICLNKKCNFESKPMSILWKCIYCSVEFRSKAKIFNKTEIKIIKKAIYCTLLKKINAFPTSLPCCKKDPQKQIFYHKEECNGILYKGFLLGKEIVVCNKCHALNYVDKFNWICPLCNKKIHLHHLQSIRPFKTKKYVVNEEYNVSRGQSSKKNNKSKLGRHSLSINKENSLSFFSDSKNFLRGVANFANNSIDRGRVLSTKSIMDKKKYDNDNIFIDHLSIGGSSQNDINDSKNFKSKLLYSKRKMLYEILEDRKKDNNNNNNNNIGDYLVSGRNSEYRNFRNYTENEEIVTNVKNRSASTDKYGLLKIDNKLNKFDINDSKILKSSNFSIIPQNPIRININQYYNNKINELIIVNKESTLKKMPYKNKFENVSSIMNNNNKNYSENKKREKEKEKEKDNVYNNCISYKNFKDAKKNNKNFNQAYNIKSDKHLNNISNGLNDNNIINNPNNTTNNFYPSNNINKIENQTNYLFSNNSNYNIKVNLNIGQEKFMHKKAINSPENNNNLINSINDGVNRYQRKKYVYKSRDPNKMNQLNLDFYINNSKILSDNINANENVEENENDNINRQSNQKIINKKNKPNTKLSNGIISKYLFGKVKNINNNTKKNICNITENNNNNKNDNNSNFIKAGFNNTRKKYQNKLPQNKSPNENEQNNNEERDNSNDKKIDKNEKIFYDLMHNVIVTEEKIKNIESDCIIPTFNDKEYRYVRLIGEGAYSSIYLVQNIYNKKEYALKKIICKDLYEIMKHKNQLELIYSLKQQNLLEIYNLQFKYLDNTTYSIYVLMEKAQNDWLLEIRKRIVNKKFYTENEIIKILKQLVSGLAFMQRKKITHRDIKPQNILLFSNGMYKIADMGEAKKINDINKESTVRGSELYMSPILYYFHKDGIKYCVHNSFKSDVFSLGYSVIYAMSLSLKSIEDIRETNSMRLIIGGLNKIMKNLYSEKLMGIIYKMIEIDESKRYDFIELESDLNKYFRFIN